MRGRTGLAVAALILLLVVLHIAGLDREIRIFDFRLFRVESSFFYLAVIVLALGGFFMFLFVSLLTPRKQTVSKPQQTPPESGIVKPSNALRQAESALQLGQHDRAESLIKSVPSSDTDNWYARKLMADAELLRGNRAHAEQLYQQSIRIAYGKDQIPALSGLAILYDEEDRPEEAENLYRRILKIFPDAVEPLLRLRSLSIRRQLWDQALGWQEQLERLNIESSEDPSDRIMNSIGIRYELAHSEFRKGSLKTAAALLKHIQRSTDSFIPAWLLTGEIQKATGHESAAMKTWERGFQLTGSPVLLQRLGEALLEENLPERAVDLYQNAVRAHPGNPQIEFALGDLYRKLEMNQEALRTFEALEREHTGWGMNKKALADMYMKMGEKAKASDLYLQLIEKEDAAPWLPWICHSCTMTYKEYRSFCQECWHWNSIQVNEQTAGKDMTANEHPTAYTL